MEQLQELHQLNEGEQLQALGAAAAAVVVVVVVV
jgi:hypothetical protein